jgi:hypothetical protein
MNRLKLPFLRTALVVGFVACTGAGAFVLSASGPSAASPSGGGGVTPLPAGWELCIMQGLAAPATQANVADLDQWQEAEGGSTNNTAAYNPFNTARTTDVNNNPLPAIVSANGFPAFNNWISGCAATVATILQPNMTSIAAGLRAGNVSPPSAFLAVVDQSQWCAPSADGTPCYQSQILGTNGSLATQVLNASSALDVFGNVRSDLRAYQTAVAAVASAQQTVAMTNQQLSAAQSSLSTARSRASAAEAALRRFAVNEYVNSGLYQTSTVVSGTDNAPFGTPSQDGVTAHEYATDIASDLLSHSQAAKAAEKEALAQRDAVEKTLQQAVGTLTSDNSSENRSLVRLVADVTTLQNAGACTTAQITAPPATSTPGGSPSTSTPGSSTPTPTTTTTTTTVPPTTTTTTEAPTTTSTTFLNLTNGSGTTTTTTTTTAPSSTTTSSSTTTTTVPSDAASSSAPPPNPNPAGLQVLQGCVTALAPSGTT